MCREPRWVQVVCATCVGVGSDMFEGTTFSAVLMDEECHLTLHPALHPTLHPALHPTVHPT